MTDDGVGANVVLANTAVADHGVCANSEIAKAAVRDDGVAADSGIANNEAESNAGDTVASSSVADHLDQHPPSQRATDRNNRVAPLPLKMENTDRRRGPSCWRNVFPEVGTFGLYAGNWGMRSTAGRDARQRLRQLFQDRQMRKCPAQVLVVAESNESVQNMMEALPEPDWAMGDPETHRSCGSNLANRPGFDYFVIRGKKKSRRFLLQLARTSQRA